MRVVSKSAHSVVSTEHIVSSPRWAGTSVLYYVASNDGGESVTAIVAFTYQGRSSEGTHSLTAVVRQIWVCSAHRHAQVLGRSSTHVDGVSRRVVSHLDRRSRV